MLIFPHGISRVMTVFTILQSAPRALPLAINLKTVYNINTLPQLYIVIVNIWIQVKAWRWLTKQSWLILLNHTRKKERHISQDSDISWWIQIWIWYLFMIQYSSRWLDFQSYMFTFKLKANIRDWKSSHLRSIKIDFRSSLGFLFKHIRRFVTNFLAVSKRLLHVFYYLYHDAKAIKEMPN